MDVKPFTESLYRTLPLGDNFSYFFIVFFKKEFSRIGLKEKSMKIVILMALICKKIR